MAEGFGERGVTLGQKSAECSDFCLELNYIDIMNPMLMTGVFISDHHGEVGCST